MVLSLLAYFRMMRSSYSLMAREFHSYTVFAHFILGHKMNLNQSDPLYDIQELEANCFAAQLLMPEQILRECSKRHKAITVDFIINSFDVSEDAAKKRKPQTVPTTTICLNL